MSESNSNAFSLQGVWFVMFVVVKVAGTGLAHWSWWWLLLPIVPDVALICTKMGWL